jgi:hypothetical protein
MAKDELKKTHETWKEKKYVYLSYMLFVWKISEIGFPNHWNPNMSISCYVTQTGVYIYL